MVEEQQPVEQIYEIPRDLYEIYMKARAETFLVTSFSMLYFKILNLIDVGKEMLPNEPESIQLRSEVENLLKHMNTYPQPSQLEYTTEGTYRIDAGSRSIGLITVRPEDIEQGRDESREQKATSLIPRLKEIDNKIFKKLVEYQIVDVKRPEMEDLMIQDVMLSIQKKYEEKEDREREALEESEGGEK